MTQSLYCRSTLRFLYKVAILGFLLPGMLQAFTSSDLPPAIEPRSDYYSLEAVEPSEEPGILQFHVSSSHAVYDVKGFKPLVKLLQEIEVIERIRRDEQGSGFFDGASASVEATATGLGNLVTHPVQSAQGVGKAVGKLGRSLGGVFRKKEEGEKSSFGEKVLGSNEREIAKEFGVDVYTTNPYLRALITKMARARLSGKSAVMVIKLLVPVAAVASVAMTAGGINGAADQLVNDSSRMELFRLNKQAFLQMGLDEKTADGLLNLSYFSPREQTYFRFYLEKLQNIENFEDLVASMLHARSEWDARRELYEMEIAAALAEKHTFVKLRDFPEGLALLGHHGKLVCITAYDDLSGGALEGAVLKQIKPLQNEMQAAALEIWNGGNVSDSFKVRAYGQGIQTRDWAYFESASGDDKNI